MEENSIITGNGIIFTLDEIVDFRTLLRQICEFYSSNHKAQYVVYIRIFLIGVIFATFAEVVLGLPDEQIVIGCILLTFFSLIILPITRNLELFSLLVSPFSHSLVGAPIVLGQVIVKKPGRLAQSAPSLIRWKSFLYALTALTKILLGLLCLSLISYSVFAIYDLYNVVSILTTSELKSTVLVNLWRISLSLGAMLIILTASLILSFWKSKLLLFTEVRMSIIKDVIINVESILRDKNQPIETRQQKSITTILKGLLIIMRMNPYERIWGIVRIFKPSANQTTIVYAVPEIAEKRFQIKYIFYPNDAPEKVKEAFEWIKQNHHPRFLDEQAFTESRNRVNKESSEGLKSRYLDFLGRAEFSSEYEWIYVNNKILVSNDTSRNILFDNSYIEQLKRMELNSDELRWLEVGSFIGCPIKGPDNRPAGVLLVQNNLPNGVKLGNYELIILVTQLIGRILLLN